MSATLFRLRWLCLLFSDQTPKTLLKRYSLTPLGLDLSELLGAVGIDGHGWEVMSGHRGGGHGREHLLCPVHCEKRIVDRRTTWLP